MTEWDTATLQAIADSDDLHISPFRDDGTTYGTPTWIWSVVVDGNLYVRAWNGTGSRWYRAAMAQHAGRIRAAGKTIEAVRKRRRARWRRSRWRLPGEVRGKLLPAPDARRRASRGDHPHPARVSSPKPLSSPILGIWRTGAASLNARCPLVGRQRASRIEREFSDIGDPLATISPHFSPQVDHLAHSIDDVSFSVQFLRRAGVWLNL